MKSILIFSLFFIFSNSVWANKNINSLCEPLSRAQKWHAKDTIYYVDRVAPAYQKIVNESKKYAIKNTTFKSTLAAMDYDLDKINSRNSLRLQQECNINDLSSKSTCHHFKAYCLNDIATTSMGKSFDNFNHCAITRANYCGESFQTVDGVKANIAELNKAYEEISKVQEQVIKDPNLNQYFGDVQNSFDDLKKKLELAKKNANKSIADIEKEIKNDYSKLKSKDSRYNNACNILDQCDDYLEKEGYEDNYNLLAQTSVCHFNHKYSEDSLKPLENLLDGINNHNQKENLKSLAINSLNNATEQTVKEWASISKALNGKKPTSSDLCKELPDLCKNDLAQTALKKMDLSNTPKLDQLKEIKSYNEMARQMNSLCKKSKNGFIDKNLETEIQTQLTKVMYESKIGQLMGVQNFREKIPPFNQKECLEEGIGFSLIEENNSGVNLLTNAIKGIKSIQKDKAEKLKDQKNQVVYAGKWTGPNDKDYFKILKDIIQNDPYMVREAIKLSGSPEEALWICKATHSIYKNDRLKTIGTWTVTGLALAGSLVATVFTFGAATPLLVASIAAATSVGVYNLNNAITARHNAEQSMAISSSDQILLSMNLEGLDSQVKAGYVEVGMSLLPGAIKGLQVAGKAVGPVLKGSQLLKALPASTKISQASSSLLNTIKAGGKVTEKMIQKALASKLPNASPEKIQTLASILQGTSADMSLEIITFASIHPDPFSEEGMQSLAIALSTSTAFNSLGPAGRQWALKRKQSKLNNLSVLKDVNTPQKSMALNNFKSEVELTPKVGKLMDNAHNAPSGFQKNKQIKLLVDEVSTQPGMTKTKAKDLVLGKSDETGIRKGGLASEDVMILGHDRKYKFTIEASDNPHYQPEIVESKLLEIKEKGIEWRGGFTASKAFDGNGNLLPDLYPSYTHVIRGNISTRNGVPILSSGMHTDRSLKNLIKNNPVYKEKMLDATGSIKSDYYFEFSNGVRRVLIPRIKPNGSAQGNQTMTKDLFPKSWDSNKILDAVNKVVKRQDPDKFLIHNKRGFYHYTGEVDGVKLDILIDEQGGINTVFPMVDETKALSIPSPEKYN